MKTKRFRVAGRRTEDLTITIRPALTHSLDPQPCDRDVDNDEKQTDDNGDGNGDGKYYDDGDDCADNALGKASGCNDIAGAMTKMAVTRRHAEQT